MPFHHLLDAVIYEVGPARRSPNGHVYVECESDHGTIAVWGSKRNPQNVRLVTSATTPFRIRANARTSDWAQHDWWIPERSSVSVCPEEEPTNDTVTEAAPVLPTTALTRAELTSGTAHAKQVQSKHPVSMVTMVVFLAVYGGGCQVFNEMVRRACVHGNCEHGWYSKDSRTEQNLYWLWAIGVPVGVGWWRMRDTK